MNITKNCFCKENFNQNTQKSSRQKKAIVEILKTKIVFMFGLISSQSLRTAQQGDVLLSSFYVGPLYVKGAGALSSAAPDPYMEL